MPQNWASDIVTHVTLNAINIVGEEELVARPHHSHSVTLAQTKHDI
jgi:hypothetical protein